MENKQAPTPEGAVRLRKLLNLSIDKGSIWVGTDNYIVWVYNNTYIDLPKEFEGCVVDYNDGTFKAL